VPALKASQTNSEAAKLVETAVAEFNTGHPYLLFHKPRISQIRKRTKNNSKLLARLQKYLCETNAVTPGKDPRTVIKHQARSLINISFMALFCDGSEADDAAEASRKALRELSSAASWRRRPAIKSFLDCAETAVAVSLAYDWLYDKLPDEERSAIESALFRHVLEPALAAYEDPMLLWPRRRDNCALVSHSGILIAALAVLGQYRDLATQLIAKILAASRNIFEAFAPDGAWPEGLSYWSLAIRYASLMVAALESALGDSFGLADWPGFSQTGDFALHTVGPFGAAFNFGDSERQYDVSPLAWLAHRFQRPIDSWLIRDYDGWYLPFTTIWGTRPRTGPTGLNLPRGKIFRGSDLACFRNTWSAAAKERPVYLAIKGGNALGTGRASSGRPEDIMLHTQADAGSFVVDGARRRWVIDLGSDDYDLPGYFDPGADNKSGPRWRYYRTHAVGHNTLVVDGLNQVPNARTPILGSCIEDDCKWVVFDLSAAYGKPADSIRRGAALVGRQVVIQDEIEPEISDNVVWAIHTSANPDSVVGSVARFRIGDDRFVARILEPDTARFELTFPPAPCAFQVTDTRRLHGRGLTDVGGRVSELPRRDDEGGERAAGALIRRLEIQWPRGARRLTVLLLPDCDVEDQLLPVTSLDQWLAQRPVRLPRFPQPLYRTEGLCDLEQSPLVELPTLEAGPLGKYSQMRIDHA
jgi:Heparinase II/III-like protein